MPEAGEPGRRPAQQQQQFAGVDLRRPKGYAAAEREGADPCPRCASRDTKFCYYNNYNTAQPRHFCKGCRRYWTKGGTLRNVPVGGGTRKRPSPSSPPSAYAAADKPKREPAGKKRRVEAPEPAAKATTADGASDITAELVVAPAASAAEEEDSLAHLLRQPEADDAEALALGLGLADFPAGKGLLDVALEPDSFEWPAAFDLGVGACWGGAGFVDPDPAGLFLNLP